jgi:hypothetical protein
MSLPQVFATLVCLVTLAQPSLSTAAYLIHLRNGRQVRTFHYWQQDHRIMFYTAGGVGGVAASAVLQIQTIDDPPEADLPHAAEPKAADTAEEKAADIAEPKAADAAEPKAAKTAAAHREREQTPPFDLEASRHQKEALKSQLDTALERYRAASSAHNREEKAKLQAELTALSKQLFDLTDAVKQQHQGRLPEGWENF